MYLSLLSQWSGALAALLVAANLLNAPKGGAVTVNVLCWESLGKKVIPSTGDTSFSPL